MIFIHLILDKRNNKKHKDKITVQSLPLIYSFSLSLLQSSSPLITASNSLNILAPIYCYSLQHLSNY